MRIFEINSVPYGSTGKIMLGIADIAQANGHEVAMAAGYSYHPIKELQGRYTQVGSIIGKLLHTWGNKLGFLHGSFSYFATRKLCRKIKKFQPDIIHLHNVHGWYLHLPTLFAFIKKQGIRVVWTLHDCWAFTGQCPHFDMIGCEKWKTGCYACPQCGGYPKTYIDRSKTAYKKKKNWFTGVKDLTIVTPSAWLAGLVKKSFLQEYPVCVINNGIDLTTFKPMESDFRKKYGCENKTILLGVSFGWGEKKGLDVFVELAKRLPDSYQVVLVGTDEITDKLLPENIISIHRTQNTKELAEIYSAADVFVNPTREENFPTVNIESLACGTPIVTFATGGSPEIIDETCGVAVAKNDVDELVREIERIVKNKPYLQETCVVRAKEFDMQDKFLEYVKLYENREK